MMRLLLVCFVGALWGSCSSHESPSDSPEGSQGGAGGEAGRASESVGGGGQGGRPTPEDARIAAHNDAAADSAADVFVVDAAGAIERSCPRVGLAWCEDFETYRSGPLVASAYKFSGATPVVDDQRAARGRKSLHVHAVNGGPESQLLLKQPLPLLGGVTFGRMFVWIDKLPKDYVHWTLVGATGKGVGGESRIGGILEGSQDPKWIRKWGVGGDHGPLGDWTAWDNDPAGHAQPVATQTWNCIEWLFDGSRSEVRFWKDGVEHNSMKRTNVPLPEFDTMWFGIDMYQDTSQKDYDVWFDNLALSTKRIGCDD